MTEEEILAMKAENEAIKAELSKLNQPKQEDKQEDKPNAGGSIDLSLEAQKAELEAQKRLSQLKEHNEAVIFNSSIGKLIDDLKGSLPSTTAEAISRISDPSDVKKAELAKIVIAKDFFRFEANLASVPSRKIEGIKQLIALPDSELIGKGGVLMEHVQNALDIKAINDKNSGFSENEVVNDVIDKKIKGWYKEGTHFAKTKKI